MLTQSELCDAIDQYVESPHGSFEKISSAHKIAETLRELALSKQDIKYLEHRIVEANTFKYNGMYDEMEAAFADIVEMVEAAYNKVAIDIPALVTEGLQIS